MLLRHVESGLLVYISVYDNPEADQKGEIGGGRAYY
jgi:hypothetical protein